MIDPKRKAELKEEWKYADPHSSDRGILLADQIHELCDVGLLIAEEYKRDNLRPASYTLRVGKQYIGSDGSPHLLTDEDDSFVFGQNSIVFVSTMEKLEIPFYIAARFNIRVAWVYDGVLLGTGPQVDPGFSGFLSCPLYNLTNLDITIKRGQDFATIDFEKTTGLLPGSTVEEKKRVIEEARDKEISEISGRCYSFYKVPPLSPLKHKKAHRIVSSLLEMREEVRTWRHLGIGSVIAFFGLTLSLLGLGVSIYRQNSDLGRQLSANELELQRANARISSMEMALKQLRSSVEPSAAPPASASPAGNLKEKLR